MLNANKHGIRKIQRNVLKYNQQRALKSEYQESHKKSSQKHYQSKKDVNFPPLHLLQSCVRILYQILC